MPDKEDLTLGAALLVLVIAWAVVSWAVMLSAGIMDQSVSWENAMALGALVMAVRAVLR